jgi:hypothetical protein
MGYQREAGEEGQVAVDGIGGIGHIPGFKAEYALDADDQPVAQGCHGPQESLGPAGEVLVADHVAVVVEDADVHGPSVQVDAAVEWM